MIFTIAARELRSLFLSPLAWIILAVMTLVFGIVFDISLSAFKQSPVPDGATAAVVPGLYELAMVLLFFIVPMITMRLFSEERRNQSLPLLFSAPVSMTEIVLGKYLGVVAYLMIMVVTLTLMPISMELGTSIDVGLLFANIIGMVLLLGSFTAIGLFMSTLTQVPALAAILAFGALFLLWLLKLPAYWFGENAVSYLSIASHYENFLKGVFSSADVVYYIVVIVLFLAFSVRRLEADRLGG
ncbi:MAG: ABC transporter permease subunit [Acidiferrobacterales bacterium]|jgi:ABC-2 type transport system permease protein|nr:ABC transporter permease subunit [Acidiferrobacterales bacterium]